MRALPWIVTGLCVVANLGSLALIIQSGSVHDRPGMQRLASLAARLFLATLAVCVAGFAVTALHGPAPAPGSHGHGGTMASAAIGTLVMTIVFSAYPGVAAVWLHRKLRELS